MPPGLARRLRVFVLSIVPPDKADGGGLIVDWRPLRISAEPVFEFSMERLIVPAGAFSAQRFERGVCDITSNGLLCEACERRADRGFGVDRAVKGQGTGIPCVLAGWPTTLELACLQYIQSPAYLIWVVFELNLKHLSQAIDNNDVRSCTVPYRAGVCADE
jgi:hypothetical protein